MQLERNCDLVWNKKTQAVLFRTVPDTAKIEKQCSCDVLEFSYVQMSSTYLSKSLYHRFPCRFLWTFPYL